MRTSGPIKTQVWGKGSLLSELWAVSFFFLICSFGFFLLCQGSQPSQSQRSHWVRQYVPCVAPLLAALSTFLVSAPARAGQELWVGAPQ